MKYFFKFLSAIPEIVNILAKMNWYLWSMAFWARLNVLMVIFNKIAFIEEFIMLLEIQMESSIR